jgi:1,2-diacylglycerol 3-alpha-glucosyltransferase
MRPGEPRALMVYLEPAPYIIGLVDAVRSIWDGTIEVVFAHDALTQPWGYELQEPGESVLRSGSINALGDIRHILANGNYSLIHVAGWGDPILLGALLLGSLLRIPVTVESDTPLPHSLPIWKRLAKEVLYRPLFRLPAVFLPGGSRQAAYLRHYGVEEERIQIARMTVDVSKILSYSASMQRASKVNVLRRHGIPENYVKILYLGRLEPHKGLFDLLEGFKRLKRRIDSICLLIAGEGSLTKLVEQQASSETSIYYMGRLSGERVWEAYAISDVFVLPSHREPWGLVVNEAMASGLPVIVTDRVGCVDDLVEHKRTGLIVPAESPEELLVAMEALVSDANARQCMGAEARQVIAAWTLENAAKATTLAWRKALQ